MRIQQVRPSQASTLHTCGTYFVHLAFLPTPVAPRKLRLTGHGDGPLHAYRGAARTVTATTCAGSPKLQCWARAQRIARIG